MGFDKSYDPCKASYGSMPTHAESNPKLNNFISMIIFDMLLNLAYLPMDWELLG